MRKTHAAITNIGNIKNYFLGNLIIFMDGITTPMTPFQDNHGAHHGRDSFV